MSGPLDPALARLLAADLARARSRSGLGCWSMSLGLGTLVSLVLGGYLVLDAASHHHTDDVEQFGAIFGLATVVLGLGAVVVLWKQRQVRSPLHEAVVVRREDVVWVYPKQTNVDLKDYFGGQQVGRELHLDLVIAFADATSVEVGMGSREELSEATAVLARWLPRAQHGYARDLAGQYAASPASLRRG